MVFNTEPCHIPRRCGDGFWRRFGRAIKCYYITVNDDGEQTLNIPRVIGIYSGELVTHAIYRGGSTAGAPRGAARALWWSVGG